jgi:hypothetical protein
MRNDLHAEARLARALFRDQFVESRLGAMEFFDTLNFSQKMLAAVVVNDILICVANLGGRAEMSQDEWNNRGDRRTAIAPTPAPISMGYQDRVAAVHRPLFDGDPTDIAERRDRNFEEGIETAQAFGMTREEAIALVEYTFSRPVGDPMKELGSQILTAFSLAVEAGIDAMAAAEADLEKLQRPETIARIRAKRATRHGRGPLPGLDPTAPPSKVGIVPRDARHHAELDATHRMHPDGSYFK